MSRPTGPPPGQQPLSFKTVPGRNKTQKWQQAKTYNYDGDDWGGYDPYDEYGGNEEPEQSQAPQPSYAQRPQRQNSFDAGAERRQFSAGHAPPGPEERRPSPAVSSGSGGRPSGDYARHAAVSAVSGNDYDAKARGRNFTNPEQVPPPLNTRDTPARSTGPQSASAFPPRKSSISHAGRSPAREPMSAGAAKSVDKPLPFIRPSDIYRRMAEEKERDRQSLDSSRPSMDSIQRGAASSPPARAADSPASSGLGRRPSLEPVAERRELGPVGQTVPYLGETPGSGPDMQQEPEYRSLSSLQPVNSGGSEAAAANNLNTSPVLPPVSRFSGFGSDFLHNTTQSEDTSSRPVSPEHHIQSTIARVLSAPVVNSDPSHVPSSSPLQTTPVVATRAPYGRDPAEEMSAERQHAVPAEATRAPQGQDPAADILAERRHGAPTEATRAPHGYDPAADILAERQHGTPMEATRAPHGYDPAADILAERQHATPVHAVGRHDQQSDLQHQPSTGFRSVVQTAFDRQDDSSVPPTPISRDNSQSVGSGSGVSRSNTNSTAGISPIMSRVPSAATAQDRQQERDAQVPPIAEEPASARTPTQSRSASGNYLPASSPQHYIPRKPSPGHSRNTSAEMAAASFQPGYRRSLDPPSQDNSPARTPGLEDGSNRRVSAPMAAETFPSLETPDVEDQGAEMPTANLEPMETPMSELGELPPMLNTHLPTTTGRGRSGTDYSVRESDLADTVSMSPHQPTYSPPVAEDHKAAQQQFLRTHNTTGTPSSPASPGFARPVSPGLAARGLGIARSTTPGSIGGTGRDSPAKGRVREIAETYNSIEDESRRNSAVSVGSGKSGWSNFRGSEENLAGGGEMRRRGTGGSQLVNEADGVGEDGHGDEDRDGYGHEGMFPQYEQSQDRSHRGSTAALVPLGLGAAEGLRPGVESQASFRPHLPGEWVSYAPTPMGEEPPTYMEREQERDFDEHEPQREWEHEAASPLTPRASHVAAQEEAIDLTPTTKKTQLRESYPTPDRMLQASPAAAEDEVVDFTPATKKTPLRQSDPKPDPEAPASALDQLKNAGAALGASLMNGAGLVSTARDFGSTEPAQPVVQPEMQPRAPYGDMYSHLRPSVPRQESEMTDATDATMSVASSAPPTPPTKDPPRGGLAPADTQQQREIGPGGRPISSYFSGAIPPLRTGQSRDGPLGAGEQQMNRPTVLPSLSTDTGAGDLESDRLRKEIVRSLDPGKREQMKRESILEDGEGTQDALDGPEDNRRRVEGALSTLPSAQQSQGLSVGGGAPGSAAMPRMLDQRFSWENRPQQAGVLTPPEVREPKSPDIKPEMPYERPRSMGLHIVNTSASEETPVEEKAMPLLPAVQEPEEAGRRLSVGVPFAAGGPVSPISKSQENLALPMSDRVGAGEEGEMSELAPSPISDRQDSADSSTRLPSYYQTDSTTAPTTTVQDASPATSPSGAAKRQSAGQRILPFREILAIKSSPDRIRTYNDTRQTFADMDTGLNDWLSGMLTQHPEHASLSSVPAGGYKAPALLGPSATFSRHKASPSLIKFTKQFGSATDIGGEGRKVSASGANGGSAAEDMPPKTPNRDRAEQGIDMEKMQQRGKDLMKNASVLGGKVGGGAKGLFAKGRSRFGGGGAGKRDSGGDGKAPTPPPPPAPRTQASSSPAPPYSHNLAVAAPSTRASSTSPVPRTRSQTPSSVASRPLSQTFSRLRERSRSKSRPGSLVITNPDIFGDGGEYPALPTTAGAAVSESRQSPPGERTEAWNEPDAALPPGEEERSVTPARLGVLPSPAAETFSFLEQSPPNSAVSRAPVAEREDIESADGEVHHQQQQQQPAVSPETPRREVATPPPPETRPERPQQERKVSALATLPSQQRALGLSNPTTPRTPTLGRQLAGESDDELYGTTPTASKARSPAFEQPTEDEDLYGSTPVASRAPVPWRLPSGGALEPMASESKNRIPGDGDRAVSGAEAAFRSLPAYEATALGASAASGDDEEVARPETADASDKRSEVSAEDQYQGADEEEKGPEDYGSSGSRRSSISSLGSPDTVIGNRASVVRLQSAQAPAPIMVGEQPIMTARAVPAGPVGSSRAAPDADRSTTSAAQRVMQPPAQRTVSDQAKTPDQQRFMNRSYRGHSGQQERPISYMPLGQDRNGAPAQEAIAAGQESQPDQIDLSGFGGPPLGTPPFQQHPVFRNSVASSGPSELRYSQVGSATPSIAPHSRQVSADTSDRTSRRYSGFFRGPDPAPSAMPGLPPPHAMTPSYGLDDLDDGSVEAPSSVPLKQREDKQSKRRSGIWEAFKRSPSVSQTNFSRDGSALNSRIDLPSNPALLAASRAREATTQQNTLKKAPQRAASTATLPTEPKKKPRFSRLGSLFGRSNTQGHNTPKPNKLTKTAPPSREDSMRQRQMPSNSAAGYDAYEAMRRQQNPSLPRGNTKGPYAEPTMSSPYRQPPLDPDAPGVNVPRGYPPPPQSGWYGPGENQSPSERVQSPQQTDYSPQRPGQFRRLHSEGQAFQRGLQQANIPEAFRPTEASYGLPAAPIGPPPEHQPPVMYEPPSPARQPTLPTRQPYWGRQPSNSSKTPAVERQVSSGSGGYQLSHQVSSLSEYQRAGWSRDGSLPPVPTVQTHAGPEGFAQGREQRVGAYDPEMARSPAREYAEQQTPWPISLPQNGDESRRNSRVPSWGISGASPSTQADRYASPPGPPSSMRPPSSGRGYGMPMSSQSPGASQPISYTPTHAPGQAVPATPSYRDPQGGPYPSPPYTPQTPSQYYQPQPQYGPPPQNPYGQPYQPQQRPPQQQRYYAQQRPSSRPGSEGRPLTYQRTPSGFSGRRDDAAVSEEHLMGMQGASYPGQEWTPRM